MYRFSLSALFVAILATQGFGQSTPPPVPDVPNPTSGTMVVPQVNSPNGNTINVLPAAPAINVLSANPTVQVNFPKPRIRIMAPVVFETTYRLKESAQVKGFVLGKSQDLGGVSTNLGVVRGKFPKGFKFAWINLPANFSITPDSIADIGSEFSEDEILPPPSIVLLGQPVPNGSPIDPALVLIQGNIQAIQTQATITQLDTKIDQVIKVVDGINTDLNDPKAGIKVRLTRLETASTTQSIQLSTLQTGQTRMEKLLDSIIVAQLEAQKARTGEININNTIYYFLSGGSVKTQCYLNWEYKWVYRGQDGRDYYCSF